MKLDLVAYAKINLILDVLGKREDGYHEVEMIMQTINLADKLTFIKTEGGIEIEVNHPLVPRDEKNLVYQAIKILFDEYDLKGGLKVVIDKKIPVAAGLAGGSTDAASALVAVNKLWDLNLSKDELALRGAKLGADIPFCIEGGTQLATGIGTKLEKIANPPQLYMVVVNPPFEVATAGVYKNFDLAKIKNHPQSAKVIAGLKKKDKNIIIDNLANVLETVTLNQYPDLNKLKDRLAQLTDKVLMSGSGPTLLGFVEDKKEGERIKERLEDELEEDYRILLTKTVNQGISEI